MTARPRRRGNNEGSVYQRPDGRWAGAVTLANGKRKYTYGKTRAEAADKMAILLAKVKQKKPLPDDQITIRQFVRDRWLPTVQRSLAPKTVTSYTQTYDDHIDPYVGRLRLSQLEPWHVQMMMDEIEAAGGSAHQQKYARSVLGIALTLAEKWGTAVRNVVLAVDPPRVEPKEVEPLTVGEARALLGVVKGDQMAVFYLLAMCTGLRLGELLGLDWDDIDLDQAMLVVRRQVQRNKGGGLAARTTKTPGSKAAVALPRIAADALREHRRATARLSGYVFLSAAGRPLDPSNVRRHLRRAMTDAGLTPRSPHALRHSTATFLQAAKVPPRVAQAVLRHANIRTTLGVYTHANLDLQREAMDGLDSLFTHDPGNAEPLPHPTAIPTATDRNESARTGTEGN